MDVIVPKGAEVQTIGILGAVIMPHNIYLHSALVQVGLPLLFRYSSRLTSPSPLKSRNIDRTKQSKVKEAVVYNAIESAVALFMSFIVNAFVISIFAASFYPVPADEIGLYNAGDRLGQAYGTFAKYMWAIGLLAAGQSSTMTGTYAGQFVMSGPSSLPFSSDDYVPWCRCARVSQSEYCAVEARDDHAVRGDRAVDPRGHPCSE